MEYEFDKEIDSLLRQARPETAVSKNLNAHLDADELSLFAENALTQKARMRATEHLADCAKCRKILSNIIALNAEESSENLHTEEVKPSATEVSIPWYRKLFVFPQLAYTMGGLTVLLAGMIGYVALQSYQQPRSDSIAQMEKSVERPRGASGADSDGESVTFETYSANTASNAPLSASNAASVAANSAMNSSSKSNVAAVSTNSEAPALKKDQAPAETFATPSPLNETITADATKNEADTENKEARPAPVDNAGRVAQQDYSRNSVTRNQTQIMPDSESVQNRQIQNAPSIARAPMSAQQTESAPAKRAAKPRNVDDKQELSEKRKSVSGKDFVYQNGVWYDRAYKQQNTVNVRRNSDEYKKLDSGLRAIADNLGGTVVIIWKTTAYRIQ